MPVPIQVVIAVALVFAVLAALLGALLLRGRRTTSRHAAASSTAAALAEAIAELATITAFTLRVERDGRYITQTVLGALHSWLGYTDDETSSREAWRQLVHPEDRTAVEHALRQALGGEKAQCDVRYVSSAGESRRLRLGLRPERDRWGWVSAIHGVLREPAERPGADVELATTRQRLEETAAHEASLKERASQLHAEMAELSSTTSLLDDVFDNAPLPIICMDRDFRLVRVNAASAVRFGQPTSALLGRTAAEMAPDAWRRVEAICRAVLERGTPVVDVEVTMHGPHGDRPEARTYLASLFPVRAPDGTVTGIGAYASDITDRKRLEEALRVGEQYLRDLADAMPQIVYILGPGLQYEFVNRRFADFTGLPEREHASLQAAVHPDDWSEVRPRIMESMTAGQPHEAEIRMREAATGHYRWFLLRTVPQRDATGHPTRWFGTATDIHEQKRIQRALQYTEARQRALADAALKVAASLSLTQPLEETLRLVTDLGREVVGAREAILSTVPEAASGQALLIEARAPEMSRDEGHGPSLAERLRLDVERSGRPQRLGQDEVARLRQEEGPAPNGAIAIPITGRDGQVLGVVQFADRFEGAFTAADEAVAVQMAAMAAVALENSALVQRIRAEDQRKDEFLATLSHELRNPLAPIANSLELLRHVEQDGQILQRARGTMERQMGQMVHLIDDLLDASRISRGKMVLRRQRVSLQSVLAAALEATRPQLVRSGQVLDVALPEAPIWLDADPTRLTQIFSNLLDNAAKFSEAGGHVSVTTASRDGQVTVLVRDTGVGIPSDQLATIFDMFAQADHSVERSAGGLGIGLALVRGLVEMHGGSIQATSEGTKQGTEMRVTLPLAVDVHETPERPAPAERAHGRRRILVADDNQDSADSLVALLELAGHEAHAVYDGASAVEAAVRLQPDVVLLDLGMPRVSGHEAALRIRQGPARSAALVALTGWGDEQTRQRTHEEGFDAHLTKPVDFQELLALLDVS
ncbi:MAG: PAS domain-containing protein [Gemmatimonadales bacterium]